jgi:hypothetical protein
MTYRRFAMQLRPRLVVAWLFLASDFANDAAFQSWRREGQGVDYESFRNGFARRQRKQAEYVSPLTLLQTLQFGRLLEKSWLYARATDSLSGNPVQDRYRFTDGSDVVFDQYTLEFAAAPASLNDPRIEDLFTSLKKLQDVVDRERSQLLIALVPSKEELFGVPSSAASLNVVGRTKQRLRDAKVQFLDLYGAIQDAATVQSPYYSDDMHMNAFGSAVVAQEFVIWFNAHHRERRALSE